MSLRLPVDVKRIPETAPSDVFASAGGKAAQAAPVAKPAEPRWTGTTVDLVFGSNSQIRALAERYACRDSQRALVRDFVVVWNKEMTLGRFDLV